VSGNSPSLGAAGMPDASIAVVIAHAQPSTKRLFDVLRARVGP